MPQRSRLATAVFQYCHVTATYFNMGLSRNLRPSPALLA